jgi:hypothetical protein
MKFREGGLEFDFPSSSNPERLDASVSGCEGMKSVDFMVEEKRRDLLIEIKDPSQSKAPETERKKFLEKIKGEGLINEELTPKARDSYTFLHLMQRDSREFIFVVFLGLGAIHHEPALLMSFKERLLRRIRQEASVPWRRNYIKDCIVVTESSWATHFPQYHFSRIG